MPGYVMLFLHSITLDDNLNRGDAFRWEGVVWCVDEIDSKGRLILTGWPNEKPYPDRIHGVSA